MKLTQTSGDASITLECDASELALLIGGGPGRSEPEPTIEDGKSFYFKVMNNEPLPEKVGHKLWFVSRRSPDCFHDSPAGALCGNDWAWAFFLPDQPPYD